MLTYKARKKSSTDSKATLDKSIASRPTSLSVALAAKSSDLRHLRRALRDPRCHASVSPCHRIRMAGGENGERVTTALHLCCHPERKESLNEVCRYVGADRMDVNVRDWRGNSALHHAVVCNNAAALMSLAQQPGADLCAVNKEGKTPLILALDLYRKVVGAEKGSQQNRESNSRKVKDQAGDLWQCIQFLMNIPKPKTSEDKSESRITTTSVTPYPQSSNKVRESKPNRDPRLAVRDRNNNIAPSSKKRCFPDKVADVMPPKRARSPIRAPSPSSFRVDQQYYSTSRSAQSQERVSNWLNNVSRVEVFEVEDD